MTEAIHQRTAGDVEPVISPGGVRLLGDRPITGVRLANGDQLSAGLVALMRDRRLTRRTAARGTPVAHAV
jgi:hypothetical protein